MVGYCQTETSIKRFMLADLEGIGPAAEWDVEEMENPYIELILACGVSDIAQEPNQLKVRQLARVFAWRKLARALTGEFDFKADGGEYKRSQVYKAVHETLKSAERDADQWLAAAGLTDEFQVVQNVAVF